MIYKKLTPAYDTAVAELVRSNLKAHHLDIPGTVYFDDNLYHLSAFYNAKPDKRSYFVMVDETDTVLGGIGPAEFEGIPDCAELQKLYLYEKCGYKEIERPEAVVHSTMNRFF